METKKAKNKLKTFVNGATRGMDPAQLYTIGIFGAYVAIRNKNLTAGVESILYSVGLTAVANGVMATIEES